ncbi:MAG: hypothetical protein KAT68_15495 [Bacteroidales bacterium]|nr:hypothetical protein [Bacteroidales bacterium]
MLKFISTIFFFLIAITLVFGQNNYSFFIEKPQFNNSDSNSLYLDISNTNFLKNNEYFNDFIKGYTLIGYNINPQIVYYTQSKVNLKGGIFLNKYSGIDNYSKILPTFSITYFDKGLEIIMGTIKGTINHNLIEPLFHSELFFTDNIENGMQIIFNKNYFNADIWVNWKKFIFNNDTEQENFTFGISTKTNLSSDKNKLSISVLLQSLTNHWGGQIDTSGKNIKTILNSAAGFDICYNINGKIFNSINSENYFITFNDMSPTVESYYKNGNGFFSKININTKNTNLSFGFLNTNSYISPLGNPMYLSVSAFDSTNNKKHRQLLTGRVTYYSNINSSIKLGLEYETFYDLANYNFDYYLGIVMYFKQEFFLNKLTISINKKKIFKENKSVKHPD